MYRLKKENTISTDGKVTVQADKDKFKINIDGKSTQATRILPEEYQQLEYIITDGFQTIDTNYKPNNNTRIITKFQYTSATTDNSQYNTLFGILRPSNSDVAYNIRQFDYGYTRASYNTSRDITLDQSLNNSNLHVVDFNKNLLYLDGNLLKTFNEGVFQANTNLFIFNDRKNIASTGKTGGKMKMYYFIIYENNNIIRNFIPCYRKSDNTIGLYDLINNSFYTNSNTAFIKDFTKGDNIQIPSPEFPSEIKSIGDDVNLFDKDTPSRIDKEVVWKATETGGIYSTSVGGKVIRWNFELDTNSYYTFSYGKRNSDKLYLYIRTYTDNTFKTVKTMIVNDSTNLIKTFKPDSKYVSILFQGSVSINNIEIPDIKLQKGDKPTPYSEYGKGTVTIEQSSKNLLRMNFKPGYEYTTNGITFKVNDDYSVTINGTATNKAFFNLNFAPGYVINIQPNDKYTIYSGNTNKALLMTFRKESPNVIIVSTGLGNEIATSSVTITSEGTAFAYIAVEAGKTVTNEVVYPMVLKGEYTLDTIGDYQLYFNKTYTLPLSKPLRSLPNGTKDTIEADGIHRRVGSVVLDGNSNISMLVAKTNSAIFHYYDTNINNSSWDINILPSVMSNYFENINWHLLYNNVVENNNAINQIALHDTAHSIMIGTNIALTLEEFKAWLQQNPITVNYELSEEVVEPFTEEHLEVINSMITEKGTNIFDINEDTGITINYTPEFTDEIKHAFRYGVTRGYLEVLDGSELIINEDNYLQSIDFDDERYVDGEGIIGSTVAKSLEGKFVNVDSEFSVENKELQAYIGAELDDGTTKYIDLGTFIVQKPDNDNVKDNTSFTSLDYMVKFNQTYKDTITYPCTLGQLLQNVCDQVGIVLGTKTFRNSNFLVENNQFVNNESCREVLKAIAQMAFSWARINQDNELVLDFNLIDEPTAEFDYDEYYDLTSNEQYGPVNTIILKNSQVEGENYTVIDPNKKETDKTCSITISDNPFAYTQAKRSQLIQAGKELFGFKYIPFTTKTIGYIYLNCQDKIRIKNMQDKLLDSYLFNNKFSYEGSISDNKETSAMTETETKYQFTDTLENKLNAKIARTEIIVDKANQEITEVVEKQTEYDKSLTEIKAGLGSVTSTVEEIKNFKRSKRSTNEIYITDAMEDGTLSFTAIGNESVNVVLFPLNNLYPSDDLYGGNEYDG